MLPEKFNSELYHYGIVGMKWGVRRTPEQLADNRTTRKLKRRVAAGRYNLAIKGAIAEKDVKTYDDAHKKLKKEMRRFRLLPANKLAAVDAAEKAVTTAGDRHMRSHGEYKRAERIYEPDAKALKDHVNKMIDKYGAETVGNIKTKTIRRGREYEKEVLKTGVTLYDLPIIGRYKKAKYISERDYEDREERIDRKAERRY